MMVGGGSPEEGQGMVTLLVPSTVLTSLGEGRNIGGAVKGLKHKGVYMHTYEPYKCSPLAK